MLNKRAFFAQELSANHAPLPTWAYLVCSASVVGAVVVSLMAAPALLGVLGGSLAIVMIGIAVVDARLFVIPDGLVLAGLGLGLLQALIVQSEIFFAAMIGSAVRGLALALAFWSLRYAYMLLRKREGIGLGDVKLAAVAGVWLDWFAITLAVEIAAMAALTMIAILAIGGRKITRETRIPFGCFFGPAIWLAWLLDIYFFQTAF